MINEKLNKNILDLINENKTETNNIKGKILWKNISPSTSMSEMSISLLDDDYDFLEVVVIYSINNQKSTNSCRFPKGQNGAMEVITISGTPTLAMREMQYISDTSYSLTNGKIYQLGGSVTNNSNACIPLYIIGYKTGLFS